MTDVVYDAIKDTLKARDQEKRRKMMQREVAGTVEGIYVRLTLTKETKYESRFSWLSPLFGVTVGIRVWRLAASLRRPGEARPWGAGSDVKFDYDEDQYNPALMDFNWLMNKYGLVKDWAPTAENFEESTRAKISRLYSQETAMEQIDRAAKARSVEEK